MKRASYREAVAWIAQNDEPEDGDADNVAGYISTTLVADIFGVDQERVGRDVVRYRVKHCGVEEGPTTNLW
jgi:hypothetical protein